MGYESKIFVVRKGGLQGDCGKNYAQEIARFDLCKVYGVSDYLRNAPKTDCYIYSDDGNTEIITDRYGEELTECTGAIKKLGLQLEAVKEYPIDGTSHAVIVLRKVAPTPKQYPRRFAKIKQSPL